MALASAQARTTQTSITEKIWGTQKFGEKKSSSKSMTKLEDLTVLIDWLQRGKGSSLLYS